jgi:two-component system CAI-1 autoinducer sensor kinase/phosphatase CqsS
MSIFHKSSSLLLFAKDVLKSLLNTILTVLRQPLEPILHPSLRRLRWLGWFILLGQITYGFIWIEWLPQVFDGWSLRLFMALLGLVLVVASFSDTIESRFVRGVFVLICWIELPVFFSAMYLFNGSNAIWLASCVAMVIIYYALTDWRIASSGMLLSIILLWSTCYFFQIAVVTPPLADVVTYLFAWLAALMLGVSAVNLRTAHLRQTLSTMGILAHELRTPIASVALMGDILSDSVQDVRNLGAEASADRLAFLSSRLDALVRMMNYHIDMQIANARQFLPQTPLEPLLASTCLQTMLEDYPFINDAQRRLVSLEVRSDFVFLGVNVWMIQIFNNLMKNALYAMAAKQIRLEQDAVRLVIDLDAHSSFGCLQIIDCGTGISSAAQKNVFQPFYSSQRGSSHGLGLAYCQRTVHALRGTIHLSSELGAGTTITLQFPILTSQESNAHHVQF